jgi:hypothetical protein
MGRRIVIGLAAGALLCSGWALAAPPAGAATFAVTSGADDGSVGTLRWAIAEADASPGADVVSVNPSVADITLTDCVTGAVFIDDVDLVTIDGNGTTITQTCAGDGVMIGYGNTVLQELTLTGGDAIDGGGIQHFGLVVLEDVTITGNHASASGGGVSTSQVTVRRSVISDNTATVGAGGIHQAGFGSLLTIEDSTFERNEGGQGGGAFFEAPVALTGSTFADNTAASGGGILAWGDLAVAESSITGNTATLGGGGITTLHPATITNSTIADNTAPEGAGIWAQPTMGAIELSYATVVANNGPNLSSTGTGPGTGTITAFASVVALGGGGDCELTDGATVVSQGYNFGGDASCGFTQPTDTNAGGDPMLSELGLHDSTTLSSVPLSGSPLLNEIPTTEARCAGTDQRTFGRPANGACDIGAIEVRQVSAISLAVTTPYQTSVVTDLVPLVTDPDEVLAVYEVQGELHGILDAADGGLVTYTPDAGFSGTDSYTYVVCSIGDVICTATQTISVTVGAGPVAPAAPVTVQPAFTG